MTRTLMVLAGGFGTRLRSVTGPKPKALASISGKPFLSILMENGYHMVLKSLYFS